MPQIRRLHGSRHRTTSNARAPGAHDKLDCCAHVTRLGRTPKSRKNHTTMTQESVCFVVMPFSESVHGEPPDQRRITKEQWNHIYDRWIKRAVEAYRPARMVCKRSPASPGNFVKGIIADLGTSDLVIADLTGGKPNVYYELGIRHTLRTGTVIITQHLSALPSDLAGYHAFETLTAREITSTRRCTRSLKKNYTRRSPRLKKRNIRVIARSAIS